MQFSGLWVADLVITQLIQENVPEDERGIFNGTQHSLNMVFAIVRSLLVIFLPHVRTFWIVTILSFLAVLSGAIFYYVYRFRRRGAKSRDKAESRVDAGSKESEI